MVKRLQTPRTHGQSQKRYIAYLNEANPLQENYRVLLKDTYYFELLNQSPFITVKDVPPPSVIEFDTVYLPRIIGFKKTIVREVEPLFDKEKGKFIRFLYWVEGANNQEPGVDFFLTKSEAFKASLYYSFLSIKRYLRNSFKPDSYLEKILKDRKG